MLERRAAQADGSPATMWLQRADEGPLAHVVEKYGGADEMSRNLEAFLWSAERQRKRAGGVLRIRADTPVVGPETEQALGSSAVLCTRSWADLQQLLVDIAAYAALGALGGADQRVCDALQPLLLRLMKLLLSGAVEAEEEDDCGALTLVDRLVTETEHATANCSVGVAKRTADTALVVDGDKLAARHAATCGGAHAAAASRPSALPPWLPKSHEQLVTVFGFADYSMSETAALLWAGAVALAAFLMEKWDVIWTTLASSVLRAATTNIRTPASTRVIEVGCGPALVSLTLARLWQRCQTPAVSLQTKEGLEWALPSVVEMDVTDISEAAVAEAHRSFAHRNGPEVARALCHWSEGKDETRVRGDDDDRLSTAPCCACGLGTRSPTDGLRVHTAKLDLGDVPAYAEGRYDLLLASDIVYDHALTKLVAPALVKLLAPGGLAVLCCEAHRDSMTGFLPHIRSHFATTLAVVEDIVNVEAELRWLTTSKSLSDSTCRLMILRRL